MLVQLSKEETEKVNGGLIVNGTLLHPYYRICDDATGDVLLVVPATLEHCKFMAGQYGVSTEFISAEEYRNRY